MAERRRSGSADAPDETVTDMTTPTLGGEANPVPAGFAVTTETQEDRDRQNRPVGAEADVEERLTALMQTDFRLQAEINAVKSDSDSNHNNIAILFEQQRQSKARLEAAWAELDYHAKRMNECELQLDSLVASQSPKSDAWRRLTSRKFVMALVAFVSSLIGGFAGWIPPEVAAALAAATAALYGLAEAWVDNGTEKARAEVAKAVATFRPPPA